jgi:hypothetical protein
MEIRLSVLNVSWLTMYFYPVEKGGGAEKLETPHLVWVRKFVLSSIFEGYQIVRLREGEALGSEDLKQEDADFVIR